MRLPSCKLILLCLLAFFPFAGKASDIIELKNEKEKQVLGSYMEVLEDSLNQFTIQQILSPVFSALFKTNQEKYPYTINKHLSSTYWLRYKIKNSDTLMYSCIAQFNNPTISYVELFYQDASGKMRSSRAGDLLPFSAKEYKHRRITFEIPLSSDTTVIYFKIKSATYSGFSLSLYSLKNFHTTTKVEYYMQGIYLGILLLMIIYNLMTFVAVKEDVFLYFCFYIVSCAFYTLNSTRVGFEYLWPENALFNIHGSFFIAGFLLTTFTAYAIKILRLKKYYPRLVIVVSCLSALVILYNAGIEFLLKEPPAGHYLSFYFPFVFVYAIAFKVMRRGYRPALYFFAGLSFVIISMAFIILESMDLFWPTAYSVYGLHFAFVVEMVIFSYALSERLRISKEEKETALQERNKMQTTLIDQYQQNEILKDKVNKELEDKVALRTVELYEKNKEMKLLYEKIKLQSEEISKWNVKLDLDNQKLSQDIKEVITSRVLDKQVQLEDFNKIFPDDNSCYRFLEELKWEKGFKCIECSNEKHFEGKIIFSRRCTKCGYEESIIYNTIFQGSKIALSKQFYMLFLIYNSGGKISASHLSEVLTMRIKTCWAFSKKIKDKMKNHKWSDLDGWDAMILLPD